MENFLVYVRKTHLAKPWPLLTEQRRFCDAARVDRREGDAGVFVVLGMENVGKHHEAEL